MARIVIRLIDSRGGLCTDLGEINDSAGSSMARERQSSPGGLYQIGLLEPRRLRGSIESEGSISHDESAERLPGGADVHHRPGQRSDVEVADVNDLI